MRLDPELDFYGTVQLLILLLCNLAVEERKIKMDWMKLRSYSRKGQAQKNIHRGSPLPRVVASDAGNRRNATAKKLQSRLDLRLKPTLESQGKRHNKNAITKALPKLHEISEVTEMNCLSSDQRSMEANKDISEMDTTAPKDSLNLNTASKKSLRNSETTSGMTLPTGVSVFLLDCLDVDSVGSSTESTDCTTHYSSPEIFRDEKEGTSDSPEGPCFGCRNSTLLDTSKATNIDKMPQLPNLSKILGGQDQRITCGRSSQQKLHSELTNSSVVVAGKKVHKILSTMELRSKSRSSGPLLLPPKYKTQSSAGKSKPDISCRNPAENVASKEQDVKMEISSRSVNLGRNREVLASTAFLQPEDVELDLSSVHKGSLSEDFLPNTNSVYVNSEEIVPATLSPKQTIYQYLCNPPEICSIIKASPGFRPLKVLQHPLNKKELFFPPGSSEDIITSSENCTNRRHNSKQKNKSKK
ncbi:meiosis-specific kinetochore protein isoform X2 [Sceloporus undulatus]|uniref:meiosis-specific kinetochore protein isoform X2 n=1 Tax=Sceloporus undulatus TaxID=8520 RepID=UPI001C4A986D|nr:meiosis-specific kinetochore protein isoform X2 [Sceloporus undulatus]